MPKLFEVHRKRTYEQVKIVTANKLQVRKQTT